MPYLGNQPDSNFTTTTVDTFNGDNSTVAFTLSRSATTNDVEVIVENVQQQPVTAYSISGTTLTFTSAPPTGTGNIYVIHRGAAITSPTPPNDSITLDMLTATGTKNSSTFLSGDNSFKTVAVTPTAVSSQANTATDFFALPKGTTAQRPGSPVDGMIRYNTDLNIYEVYDETEASWLTVSSVSQQYSVSYLVVAGGGGGGSTAGGGGGAGGYRNSYASETSGAGSSTETPLTFSLGTTYTVTVGAGGSGALGSATTQGSDGVDSSISGSGISTITSIGGGGGGSRKTGMYNGRNGGSGGGEAGDNSGASGGSGTSGQGRDGGDNVSSGTGGAGGGGANTAGSQHSGNSGGAGGAGYASSITGSSVTRSGGGGGGGQTGFSGGAGGAGGGGAGGVDANSGTAGTVNTGGGGGGGGNLNGNGESGGSGVVILRMATASYSGTTTGSPTVTTDGSDTILTFTSSGSYTA